MSDTDKNILVRYVRNADPNVATGALRFADDDREDLVIGQAGYVTASELAVASSNGIVLEQVDESRLAELGIEAPSEPVEPSAPNADLEGATKKQLEDIADAEGVDISDAKNNDERIGLIASARAGVEEGAASLPATAGTGPGAPVAPSTTASASGTA